MPFRDPILMALIVSAATTAAVLVDRRLRRRLSVLDVFAERNGLRCERSPGAGALSAFEPLAAVAPIVEVERLVTGQARLSADQPGIGLVLAACLTGNRHRPRRHLIGLFEAPADLPPLRVLPAPDGEDPEAPRDLGFAPLNDAEGLPPGYQAQAFEPPPPGLLPELGRHLQQPGWRIELRPGRLILATPTLSMDQVRALIGLGLALLGALPAALAPRPVLHNGAGRWLN